jgi:hypothetical protein
MSEHKFQNNQQKILTSNCILIKILRVPYNAIDCSNFF